MVKDFDPIIFLELDFLPLADQEAIRLRLWQDIGQFILTRFSESLSDEELDQVEAQLGQIKSSNAALALIKKVRPGFETEKIQYLNQYKSEFKRDAFMAALK